jgi:hypothetical protein
VVWDGTAQPIMPVEPSGGPVETPDGEFQFGDNDWAYREAVRVVSDSRIAVARHAKMVRKLRDQCAEGSVLWLYFDSMVVSLTERKSSLTDDVFLPFRDWVQGDFSSDFSSIRLVQSKRVCSQCGADIPEDLTGACEHIFDEACRRFMAKKRG